MLVKKADEFASEEEVIRKNKSVKSGKTLAQVAKLNGVEVKHPEEDQQVDKKTKSSNSKTRTAVKLNPVKKASISKTARSKKKALT